MKAFQTISAVLLAFLVLVSSTSFRMEMHLCMGEIQKIAFFSKVDGCEKELSPPLCHRQTKDRCCEDETLIHKGDDYKVSPGQINIPVPDLLNIQNQLILISEVIPTAPVPQINYFHYDPPLRSWDLTVEHHVFLI